MIVVIDTNVWVSALQFVKGRGTPTLALEKAMSEDVIATWDEIDAEIVRVLTEKVSWCVWQLVLAHFGRLFWPTLGTLSFRG